MIPLRFILIAAAWMLFVLNGGAAGELERFEMPAAEKPDIHLEVVPTDAAFRFVLTVANNTEHAMAFRFNTGQSYDFVVSANSGAEIWRWSQERGFTQMIRDEQLAPKSKWTYEVVWDGRDNDYRAVPAGTYRVSAVVKSSPPYSAEPKELKLGR